MTMNGGDGTAPDDLDRLFARLESPAPPADLIPKILAQTVATAPAAIVMRERIRTALWVAYGVTLSLVLVSAVLFGQALHATGTLDYLTFAWQDFDLVRQSPGLFWSAFTEHMPWLHLLLLVAALTAWLVTTVALLRRRAPSPPPGLSHPQTATGAIR
ncbi:MAG: hypothetical protein LC793_14015 [Thermomicrobia bacterium]|nr:hypothetical protein [Thermomicrobia bacterium]